MYWKKPSRNKTPVTSETKTVDEAEEHVEMYENTLEEGEVILPQLVAAFPRPKEINNEIVFKEDNLRMVAENKNLDETEIISLPVEPIRGQTLVLSKRILEVPNIRLSCDICLQQFATQASLDGHIDRMHSLIQCTECNECFQSGEEYMKHEKVHNKEYKCKACFAIFREEKHFKEHLVTHRPTCDVCGKRCSGPKGLEKHKIAHSTVRNFICDVCGKTYKTGNALRSHKLTHQEGKLECDICFKRFRHGHHLSEHKAIHSDERRFHCDTCGKNYKTKTMLWVHVKSHLPKPDNSIGRRKPKSALNRNSESIIYPCNMCTATFTSKTGVHLHLNAVHNLKPPRLKCEVPHCDQIFRWPFQLANHMEFHKTGKPKKYPCQICGREFNNYSNLSNHKLVHKEPAVGCPYCPKRFRCKGNLKVHVRVHTGERPYSCEICGKAFAQVGDRRKHLRSIHHFQ